MSLYLSVYLCIYQSNSSSPVGSVSLENPDLCRDPEQSGPTHASPFHLEVWRWQVWMWLRDTWKESPLPG